VVEIDVKIENLGWPSETGLRARLHQILDSVFTYFEHDNVESELSAVFDCDASIRHLNERWRGIDKPTNVLSFPAFPLKAGERPKALLGDIVFALETIQREAEQQQKKFEDHLTHLMLHGILHLLGFDHQTEKEAVAMEHIERVILAEYAIADPYRVIPEKCEAVFGQELR